MSYKQRFYQFLFTWAVAKWRDSMGNPNIKSFQGVATHHAILRYLERIEGRDMQAEIVTEEVQGMIHELGGHGKFVLNDILYTCDKGRILTIARPNPGQARISGLSEDTEVVRKWSF